MGKKFSFDHRDGWGDIDPRLFLAVAGGSHDDGIEDRDFLAMEDVLSRVVDRLRDEEA